MKSRVFPWEQSATLVVLTVLGLLNAHMCCNLVIFSDLSLLYSSTYQHIMPKVKQANSLKFEVYGMNMLLSLHKQSPKDELFGKFYDCLVRSYKKLVVESHRRSAKHRRSSVHEVESSQAFLKDAMCQIWRQATLFPFNTIKAFNLSVCFLTLYVRGGEPICYNGPHKLCIIACGPKNQ